jgi:hypothetical protein
MRRMKQQPRPIVSKIEIEALVAAMIYGLACLAGLLLRLGKPRKTRRLEKLLRHAERQVECTIFMQALHELGLRSRAAPLLTARAGFRKQRSNARLIVKCGRVRLRNASPFERCMRLIHALCDQRRFLERAKRRLRHGYVDTRLVACAPPSRSFITHALALMPALADSS